MVVIAAAGNDASDTAPYCPAHIPELLCVIAVDSKDQLASFSNYGSAVGLAALGVSIQSVVPNGYGYKSGTSMAAPHVAARRNLKNQTKFFEATLREQLPGLRSTIRQPVWLRLF